MPGLLDGISTSRLKSKRRWILGVVVIAWSLSGAQTTNQLAGPMTISVDATQVMHKILHAELSYPVHSGPLTLYYPKWLPADHSPDGPIWNVAGLKFFAAGKPLIWAQDAAGYVCISPRGTASGEFHNRTTGFSTFRSRSQH